MGDPRHPAKLVIRIEGGLVQWIGCDKDLNIRVFVADYDDDGSGEGDQTHGGGHDCRGRWRFLSEWTPVVDSMDVRAILNKERREV